MVLREMVAANIGYWLGYFQAQTENGLIAEADLRGAARALEAAVMTPEVWTVAQPLALALHPHMERRGYWAEWDAFLGSLVTCARLRADAAAEARFLTRQSIIQRQRGNYAAALKTSRRAWRLCHEADDAGERARVLSNLGDLYRLLGYYRRAETLCQAAISCYKTQPDPAGLANARNRLGLVYFDQKRWAEAGLHLTQAEALWLQAGDSHGLAKTLHNLGELHRRTGDLARALEYFNRAIRYYGAAGDEIHVARVQLNVGNVYLNQPDLQRAEAVYTWVEAFLRRAGDSLDLAHVRHNLGMVYTRMGRWDEAQACFERALEQWRIRDAIWDQANTLGEMADLNMARRNLAWARACLDEARRLVERRPEAQYDSIRRELADWRSKLESQ